MSETSKSRARRWFDETEQCGDCTVTFELTIPDGGKVLETVTITHAVHVA